LIYHKYKFAFLVSHWRRNIIIVLAIWYANIGRNVIFSIYTEIDYASRIQLPIELTLNRGFLAKNAITCIRMPHVCCFHDICYLYTYLNYIYNSVVILLKLWYIILLNKIFHFYRIIVLAIWYANIGRNVIFSIYTEIDYASRVSISDLKLNCLSQPISFNSNWNVPGFSCEKRYHLHTYAPCMLFSWYMLSVYVFKLYIQFSCYLTKTVIYYFIK
jgi:hypothetical protein